MKQSVWGTIKSLTCCMLVTLSCLQTMPDKGAVVYSGLKNLAIGQDNNTSATVDIDGNGIAEVQFSIHPEAAFGSPGDAVVLGTHII